MICYDCRCFFSSFFLLLFRCCLLRCRHSLPSFVIPFHFYPPHTHKYHRYLVFAYFMMTPFQAIRCHLIKTNYLTRERKDFEQGENNPKIYTDIAGCIDEIERVIKWFLSIFLACMRETSKGWNEDVQQIARFLIEFVKIAELSDCLWIGNSILLHWFSSHEMGNSAFKECGTKRREKNVTRKHPNVNASLFYVPTGFNLLFGWPNAVYT